MGRSGGRPGTVVAVMVEVPEPGADESVEPTDPPRSTARVFDARTIAIVVVIGLVAAIVVGLIASAVLEDDPAPSGTMTLSEPTEADSARLLAARAETVDGKATNLGSFLDQQPMLVNFWQSSCVPCVDEMPLLEGAQAKNPDLTVVGVATQDRLAQAEALAKQTAITYPWIQDPEGEVYYESRGSGMPTTLLLGADGEVLATKTGAFKSAAELQAFIDQAD